MIPLTSKLESSEKEFNVLKQELEEEQFSIGGDWTYEHGMFDRALDEANKVWLRIPFEVVSGSVDGEADENDAKIRIGQPFVLKHLYEEGIDHGQSSPVFGALFNQFQTPTDPDAKIEPKWVDKAKQVLSQVEQRIIH
ncbi:shikimate kinase [Paenibacillus phyllosphaerae]|uniref:Shikimate kinase n=1 Tax=Paenibacillus phyllosphaerae TaxID=274593 RepID=A0A7W5ATG1_9BACL|nr:YugN family protein [Paenibacillus phyllosphaerae]MBB3108368.1 shikimate kinase [Paenibacillus phyllosphaerae]